MDVDVLVIYGMYMNRMYKLKMRIDNPIDDDEA